MNNEGKKHLSTVCTRVVVPGCWTDPAAFSISTCI